MSHNIKMSYEYLKKHVSETDLNILLDFINNTNNKIQLNNKFIYIVGENSEEFTKNIVNYIGKHNCKFFNYCPYKCCTDNESSKCCRHWIHKKMLVFNDNNTSCKPLCCGVSSFIKSVLGNEPMMCQYKRKRKYIVPKNNIIVYTNDIPLLLFNNSGIRARALIINLLKLN